MKIWKEIAVISVRLPGGQFSLPTDFPLFFSAPFRHGQYMGLPVAPIWVFLFNKQNVSRVDWRKRRQCGGESPQRVFFSPQFFFTLSLRLFVLIFGRGFSISINRHRKSASKMRCASQYAYPRYREYRPAPYIHRFHRCHFPKHPAINLRLLELLTTVCPAISHKRERRKMYYYFYGLCEFALATNLGVRKKSRCVGEILGKVYPGYGHKSFLITWPLRKN